LPFLKVIGRMLNASVAQNVALGETRTLTWHKGYGDAEQESEAVSGQKADDGKAKEWGEKAAVDMTTVVKQTRTHTASVSFAVNRAAKAATSAMRAARAEIVNAAEKWAS
jgi:hypothetical protein